MLLGAGRGTYGGPDRTAPLSSVISSCVMDLDATLSASYPGSGETWSNLIASPADGSAQTDNDFYLGADGTADGANPTFNGSANDPAAYWSFDGGDYFSLKTGANTTFINALHKTTGGTAWTMVAAYRQSGTAAAFFGTADSSVAKGIPGVYVSGSDLIIVQFGDSGTTFESGLTDQMTDGNDYLIIASYNGSDTYNYWLNSATSSDSDDASYSATSDNAAGIMRIGRANTSTHMPNGSRLYHFSLYNEFIDNTKAGNIISALETRHSRNYTA